MLFVSRDIKKVSLHIMPDDKFADPFIETLNKCDDLKNHLLVIRKAPPLKYVKSDKVIALDLNSDDFKRKIGDVNAYYKFFVHYLDYKVCHWIIKYKIQRDIIWVFLGAEFYEQSGVNIKLYGPKTIGYFDLLKPKSKLKQLKLKIDRYRNRRYLFNQKKKIRNKITHLFHYNIHDFNLVKKHLKVNAQFVPFFYPSKLDFKAIDKIVEMEKKPGDKSQNLNIIVGNSGYPSSNHLDVFDIISKHVSGLEVYCPFSYGDEKYIEYISQKGVAYFQNSFHPISDFMSIDEYLKFILKMDIGIMDHFRTQAMGNIIYLLYFGKKVFMNTKNPGYKFLLENNITVFDMTDFERNYKINLTQEQIENNKSQLLNLFSPDNAVLLLQNALANCR